MNMTERVLRYLKKEPKFRERRNKDRGLVNLLMDMHPALRQAIETGGLKKETVIDIVQEYATMDRQWRDHLKHNPDLRGSDYEEKAELEQKKQVELGYTPGYHQDVKALGRLQ